MADKQKIHLVQDYNTSVERLFSFFSDHNRMGEVFPAYVKRIKNSKDPKNCNGVGSVRLLIAFPLFIQETITQYNEPKFIEYKITSVSPLKNHVGRLNFTALDTDKSRLEYTIEFESLIPKTGFIIKNLLEQKIGDAVRELNRRFNNNSNY
jgi:hypothetical protein